MDSKTIKIRKGDAYEFEDAYITDKESDRMDLCLYLNGEKVEPIESKREETEGGYKHEFEIDADITDALDKWEYEWSIRNNKKEVEAGKLVIY